jgi:hypothetical protein
MRTEGQIEQLKTQKLASLAKKTADEVSSLPPAYMAGFEISIENRQVTVGRGIAHIRGKRVVHKIPYRINWADVWNDTTPQAGKKYFIYLDSGGTWRIDVIAPAYLDDVYALYHPVHQDFRYIGVFSVDTQGDYVHDITIIGYYGRGNNDAPQSGDRRVLIDGDEVRVELRIGSSWITKLKIAGTLAGATALLPMIACQGLYNVNNPPDTQLFPHPDFELYDFDGDYENVAGVDDWYDKYEAGFDSGYSKFGTQSLTDDNSPIGTGYTGAYRLGDANIGESQSFAFWTKMRLNPSNDYMEIASLYWDLNNYIQIIHHTVGESFYYSLRIRKSGTIYEINGTSVDKAREHHVGAVYDKDSDTAYLLQDGVVYSAVLGGSWGAPATCSFYVLPSYVISGAYYSRAYISYLVAAYDKYSDPYIIAEQYINGLEWDTSGKTAEDMILLAGSAGRVWIDSSLTINGAGSDFYNPLNWISAGTLKLSPSSLVEVLNTNPANTDLQTLDLSSWLPEGAKAVLLLASVYESGGSTRYLTIYDDSDGTNVLCRVSNFGVIAGFQQAIIPVGAERSIYWSVPNADVDNVTISVLGHYV